MMRRIENAPMKALISECKEPSRQSREKIIKAVGSLCGKIGENGGAYTIGAQKPVITKYTRDLTDFEVSENEIRVQDHIGDCDPGEAFFFISEFKNKIAEKFPEVTFVIDYYLDNIGYYGVRLHKYRPEEGYWRPLEFVSEQPVGKIIFGA